MHTGNCVFSDVHEAIRFKINQNPARAKRLNLLEAERGNKPQYDELDERHPNRLWAAVVMCFNRALRDCTLEEQEIFAKYHYYRIHPADIAEQYGVSKRTVYRTLQEIRKNLSCQLEQRGLITQNKWQNQDDHPSSPPS